MYKHLMLQKELKKTAKAATKKPFSTESFDDTQAYWWSFEVERAGKAVQIIPVGGSKVMNI